MTNAALGAGRSCQFSKSFLVDVKRLPVTADGTARAKARRWEMAWQAYMLLLFAVFLFVSVCLWGIRSIYLFVYF